MAFPGADDNAVSIVAHFSVGFCLGAEREICPERKEKQMLSPGLGKKIECVGV